MATEGERLRIIKFLFPSRTDTGSTGGLRWGLALLLGAVVVQCIGCAGDSQIRASVVQESSSEKSYLKTSQQAIPTQVQTSTEEKWGLEIVAVRLTAAGSLLDFRYRVTDTERVSALFDRKAETYLVDQASGARLSVPNMPKVGSLRARGKLEADRVYFILFSNSKGLVKKGGKVTLVIGDFKAEDLAVE
jgi:hypothetical protein